jgi:micrococcal nuclease
LFESKIAKLTGSQFSFPVTVPRRAPSMSRRHRSPVASFRGKQSILSLLIVAVLAVGAYLGKSQWPVTNPSSSPSPNTSTAASSDELVLVERVVDGDTLVISGGDRVRLIGVDTPETHHPSKPVQPFGPEAYEFTRSRVEGKRVQLKFDPGETKDRYGRTLAYVYIDGEFLNELLIRQGLARALTNYPFSSDMKQVFRSAEAQAKAGKRGVWSLPQSPFDVTTKPTTKKAG